MVAAKERVLVVWFWDDKDESRILQPFRNALPADWEFERVKASFAPGSEHSIPPETWSRATIIITHPVVMPPSDEPLPNLKWIQLLSAGVNNVLAHPILSSTDAKITTVSGIHGPPIAEWVTLATLALTKEYHPLYELQKLHKWSQPLHLLQRGNDWAGKKVGIAGYGSIGRQVANVFRAFGSEIHALTASPRTTHESRADPGYIVPGTGDPTGSIPAAWHSGLAKVDLHAFLGAGLNLLVICLPLTSQTEHLFSTDEFALLGPDCIVVNVARGELVDQDALVKALVDGTIRGAALDVATPEPLPGDNPLWDLENCIVSPHASSIGREYVDRSFDLAAKNVDQFRQGKALINLVSRAKGY